MLPPFVCCSLESRSAPISTPFLAHSEQHFTLTGTPSQPLAQAAAKAYMAIPRAFLKSVASSEIEAVDAALSKAKPAGIYNAVYSNLMAALKKWGVQEAEVVGICPPKKQN